MKNLLIICDDFPPHGGLRVGSFYKNLKQLGWNIEVIAFHHPSPSQEYNIFDNKPKINLIDLKNIKSKKPNKIICFFKPEESRIVGLTNEIIKMGENIIKNKNINVILATSSLYNNIFSAASFLANKYNIPWIADFRDIEEQRNNFAELSFREKLYLLRVKLRRKIVLQNAYAVISISPWHVNFLKKYNKNVFLIYNGYDKNLKKKFDKKNKLTDKKVFTILYLGSLLNKETRDPTIFLKACNNLITKKKISPMKFECKFIGHDSDNIYNFLDKNKLSNFNWIKTQSYISHLLIPDIINNSEVLLLLTSNKTRGVMTTKFFEYLSFKKPIILCPEDDGSLSNIVNKLNLGFVCNNVSETEKYIYNLYKKWESNENINLTIKDEELTIYQREYQAKQLNEILLNAIGNLK